MIYQIAFRRVVLKWHPSTEVRDFEPAYDRDGSNAPKAGSHQWTGSLAVHPATFFATYCVAAIPMNEHQRHRRALKSATQQSAVSGMSVTRLVRNRLS